MFGSAVLEVLIGLAVVFLVLGVICSALCESWAGITRARARNLARGVESLLGKARTAEFYAHSRIAALSAPRGKLPLPPQRPSYVANATFAQVVLDLLAPSIAGPDGAPLLSDDLQLMQLGKRTATAATTPIERELPGVLRRAHAGVDPASATQSRDVLAAVRAEFEHLFEQTMQRTTGWYRRRAQLVSTVSAAIVVWLVHADAIRLTQALYRDPTLRAELAAMGDAIAKTPPDRTFDVAAAKQALADLSAKATLPLGPSAGADWTWVGLLISVFAASLGAPFWFQLLGKLVSLRAAGKAAVAGADQATAPAAGPGAAAPTAAAAPAGLGGTAASGAAAAPPPAATVPALDGNYFERVAADPARSAAARALAAGKADELGLALDCARLSAAVYRDLTVAGRFAAMCGYEPLGTADQGSTQAIVLRRASDVVVCYRGTEATRLEDWLADASFKLVARPADFGEGQVHGGFAAALDATAKNVDELVRDALAAGARRIVFTGHSLGAALATLHAVRWQRAAAGQELALVTFGSPRVGDVPFARACAAAFAQRIALRFVNGRDLVTRVPPRSLGFDHFGAVRYFDDRGVLQRDGAEWFRWLADVIDASTDLRRAAGRTVEDHAMARYVGRVEAAFALALS